MPPPTTTSSSDNRRTTALVALAAASVAATVVFACYAYADMQRSGTLHARRLLGRSNLRALPPPAQRAAALLARTEHTRHLLAGWPAAGVKDAEKAALVTKAAQNVSESAASANAAAADSLEAERLRLLAIPSTTRLSNNLIPSPHPGQPPRPDPYQWLRDDDRTNETVLAHLRAENDYTKAALADTVPLQSALYKEMRSRIREDDSDVPTRLNGYWRYSFTKAGDQYRTHVRVKVPAELEEKQPDERDAPPPNLPVQVLLDENKRRAAVKAEFYSMTGLTVSPDGQLVAWAEDVEGGEKYDVVVAEAATGKVLPSTFGGRKAVKGTSGDIAWAGDSRTLLYVVKDSMDRPYKVLRRKYALGKEEEARLLAEIKKEQNEGKGEINAKAAAAAENPEDDDSNGDALVYVDPDEAYYVGLGISSSDEYLLISSGSAVTSETLVLPRDDPTAAPRVFLPRTPDVEYSLDHHTGLAGRKKEGKEGDDSSNSGWWIYTYRDADRPNSELRAAPEGAETRPGALRADPSKNGGSAPPSRAASPANGDKKPTKNNNKPPAAGKEVAVLLPHRNDTKIESFGLSGRYLAVFERKGGNQRAVVFPLLPSSTTSSSSTSTPVPMPQKALTNGRELAFDEPAYSLGGYLAGDFEAAVLRMSYASLRTPDSVIDAHLPTGKRSERKVTPVLNHFNKSDYVTERVWVPSRSEADKAAGLPGVQVPVAIVYRRDLFKKDGSSPMLLSGYGSYESSNDPYFSSARLSLLDRGVAFAVAQIRGGGDMGRQWYEDGKLLKKKNTFEDFVSVARWLEQEKYTSGDRLAIEGRSAGGLLMGAVLNLAPPTLSAPPL